MTPAKEETERLLVSPKDKLEDEVWLETRFYNVEVNIGVLPGVTINVGCDQNIVIDKLYGPLAAYPVRVRLEYTDKCSDWVFEYQNPKTELWIEKCRFDCQEDWPEETP